MNNESYRYLEKLKIRICADISTIQDVGLTADVTGGQGMLTPPRHLIPPLVYT